MKFWAIMQSLWGPYKIGDLSKLLSPPTPLILIGIASHTTGMPLHVRTLWANGVHSCPWRTAMCCGSFHLDINNLFRPMKTDEVSHLCNLL